MSEQQQDIKPEDLEAAAQDLDERGADDFWQSASETSLKHQAEGESLTYEEAREMGLIEDDSTD